MDSKKPPERKFQVGDKIKFSLHGGEITEGVVKAIIPHTDGTRLNVSYGNDFYAAQIRLWQVIEKL
jgi:hypothetical protein